MTIYTQTARFDTARALTENEMFKLAPSIFATTAHDSRSDRFRPIPTIEVLRGLLNEGFSPVGVKQSTARDAGKAAFTKHLIRLRRLDDNKKYSVGDTVCEILLKNANDGSSAYDLMAGLFRVACLNSLVTQTSTIDSVKVRHSGDVNAKVIEGTFHVLDEAQKALAAPADWSGITLGTDERRIFAEAAHMIRFDDEESNLAKAITPDQLLAPRRRADTGRDLWTTFNVTQENAIRGGVTNWARNEETNQFRRVTARAVNGIDQDVKINKALWHLAEEMAKLKAAA